SGSSGSSQPCGLPVSTAQNLQARVQVSPMIMMVAVPWLQHSPMFGHMDSSHTVANRCSRTFFLTAWYFSPVGRRARSQLGLRPMGTVLALPLAFMPFLIARVPLGLVTLLP